MGKNGAVDSMGLVELCLVLEDLAMELGSNLIGHQKAMSSTKAYLKQ